MHRERQFITEEIKDFPSTIGIECYPFTTTPSSLSRIPRTSGSGPLQPELATDMDIRNNIFLFLPRTSGGGIPEIDWSGNNNVAPTGAFQFGVNCNPGGQMAFTAGTAFAGTHLPAHPISSPLKQ